MIRVQEYLGENNTSCKEKEIILLKSNMSLKFIIKYRMITNNMPDFSQMYFKQVIDVLYACFLIC